MVDPTFWRDREARFRALHSEQLRSRNGDVLHAFWIPTDPEPWTVAGGSKSIHRKFESLAESAAVRLGHAGGPNAVPFWLDLLRGGSPNYRSEPLTHTEKGVQTLREGGCIELLCEASAEYCIKCETQQEIETRIATLEVAMYNSHPIRISDDLLDAFPDAMRPTLQTIFDAARLKFQKHWYFQEAADYLLLAMRPVFKRAVHSASEAGSMLRLGGGFIDRVADSNPARDWAATEGLKQAVRSSDAWRKFTRAMQLAANYSQRLSQLPVGAPQSQAGIRIGQNIKKLRKECGWSQDQLEAKSGVDKKQIGSHERGKSKPQPRIAKLYADAFSKALDRRITVNDLEQKA